MTKQRGAVLGIAVLSAVVGSFAAYALLMLALVRARQAQFSIAGRPKARYLAEAALVVARAKLWGEDVIPYPDPTSSCMVPGSDAVATEDIDTDGDGLGDTQVDVTVTNCGAPGPHTVTARVVY